MPLRNFFLTAAFLLIFLAFEPTGFARKIDAADYGYPYTDPYVATSTVALMDGHEVIPSGVIRNLETTVLEGRDHVHLLEGKGKLRYRFYQQNNPAPLLFIIPGLGSSAYTGYARYFAELLAGQGFHVLILPSPFNWNFTLAASRSGFPGVIQQDAQDLYAAMRIALATVKKEWRANVETIGMVGLSDGARHAAFISRIDTARKQIGIDRYLLINPPFDLLYAIRQIDAMAGLGEKFTVEQRSNLETYASGTVQEALQNPPGESEYFADWDSRMQLTDVQLAYLIGSELQNKVGEALYTSSLVFDPDLLNTPISWGYRTGRLEEARAYTLVDYVNTILIPRIRQSSDSDMTIEKLNFQSSLKSIQSVLKHNRNIFLVHNLDDFLLSKKDLAYLEQVFGNRAVFYPDGGHLGNLWYADNERHVLHVFKPLMQDPGAVALRSRD